MVKTLKDLKFEYHEMQSVAREWIKELEEIKGCKHHDKEYVPCCFHCAIGNDAIIEFLKKRFNLEEEVKEDERW